MPTALAPMKKASIRQTARPGLMDWITFWIIYGMMSSVSLWVNPGSSAMPIRPMSMVPVQTKACRMGVSTMSLRWVRISLPE